MKKNIFLKKFRAGFGLVEAMMSIFVLAILLLSMAYMFQYLTIVSVKIRENTYTTRLSELIFSKLKTIEYYYLFNYDSSIANFGLSGTYGPVTLQKTVYPYLGILNEINLVTQRYKIDRWSVETKFKIRDISDVNGDGLTSDLRDFEDSNTDLIDDYDNSIRYFRANADSDYYDTYTSTSLNKTVSELPDTNLKEVTLKLYKRGTSIHTQIELISFEMLTGIESRASGAELKLYVNQPANDTYLYDLTTSQRSNAFNITLTKPYPAEVTAYRADSVSPVRLWGETVALSTVRFYVNSLTSVLDTRTADSLGNFDFQSYAVTGALAEGENNIYAQATKDTYYSPYAPRRVVLDLNPPTISSRTPTGTVAELMPYVGAYLTDTVLSTGIPGGICQQVITMKVNGSEIVHSYNPSTGETSWIDQITNLPNKLVNGNSYTVVLEGGDNAYYKAVSTWTFTVSISDPDNSTLSISNKSPSGHTSEPLPEISCRVFDNQSGIDPYSITMKLDSQVVVSSANISGCWDAQNGKVFWTPPAPFGNGTYHTVEISVSHWANDPADKKTSADSWSFTVSY